jgi:hypothetical protein
MKKLLKDNGFAIILVLILLPISYISYNHFGGSIIGRSITGLINLAVIGTGAGIYYLILKYKSWKK